MNEKSRYLECLKKYNVTPNFVCSEEYFQKSGPKELLTGDYIYWEDGGWIVCPPINIFDGQLLPPQYQGDWCKKVWADFPHWAMNSDHEKVFMDFEYIYDPKTFLNLEGNKWQVFRKNIRKFPGRYGNAPLRYIKVDEVAIKKGETYLYNGLKALLVEWLNFQKKDEVIEDEDVILEFLFKGNNRKVLVDKNFTILGVNIWDSNHKYINFRYSFSLPHKFLSEYLRYLFYTDDTITSQNKFVNDGGTVGNPNLEAFKDKLNPIFKRKVFSHIHSKGGQNEKT